MSNRTIKIRAGGKEYAGQIGTITGTSLGYHEHYGFLTADLTVEWSGGGVSVGGCVLDGPGDVGTGRAATAYGLDFIMWVLRTVGVNRWEDLKGKQVIVLFEGSGGWGSQSVGIASTTDESEVLVFADHAKMWREGQND